MYRHALLCLVFAAVAGCGDLTEVPEPPIRLSLLDGESHAAVDDAYVPATPSRAAVQLVRAVPARSLVMLHLPDIGGAIRRGKETGIYQWLTSNDLKRELGPAADFFQASFDPGSAPVDMKRLLGALQGEAIVCLEDVRMRDSGEPDVRVLAGITVNGAEQDVEKLLALVDLTAAQGEGVKVEKGTIEGNEFSRIVGRTPQPFVIELALYADVLLAGYGRGTVTDAIRRLENPDATSLVDMPGFRETWKRCGDPRDALRIHVDLAAAGERFGRHLPDEVRDVFRALRLDQIRSIGTAIRFEGRDIVVSSFVDSPGGEDFLTQLLAAHPVDRQFLDRIPSKATAFSLFAFDGRKVVAALREALPATPRASFEQVLGEFRETGFDLEKDVFDVFGPRCAIVNVPVDRIGRDSSLDVIWNQLLGTVLMFEVQDPLEAEELLTRLPRETAFGERRRGSVAGVETIAYRMDSPELPPEFALLLAVHDGYLIVAPAEESLRRMLRGSSPATAERLRGLVADVPANAVVMSYELLGDSPGLFLDTVFNEVMASMPGASAPESKDVFRRTAAQQNFGPAISYTVADEKGIYSYAKSPTGGLGSTGGLSGLVMLTSIVVPNLQATRVRANEESAAAVMRAIHAAQLAYRNNRYRDTDGDGEGEYGLLMELIGQKRPGERRAVSSHKLLTVPLRRLRNGDYVHAGYYFRVYLPAEDGSPIGSHQDAVHVMGIDGDLAESIMVTVAWPVEAGKTGGRAYFMDAKGDLYACEAGLYGGDTAPPADLRSSQARNLASAPLRPGQPPRDGNRWLRR